MSSGLFGQLAIVCCFVSTYEKLLKQYYVLSYDSTVSVQSCTVGDSSDWEKNLSFLWLINITEYAQHWAKQFSCKINHQSCSGKGVNLKGILYGNRKYQITDNTKKWEQKGETFTEKMKRSQKRGINKQMKT